jgi:hypothetical protein
MPPLNKSQQNDSFLNRASPAYRAAVMGRGELPARKTSSGAVRFRALGVAQRKDGGHDVLRATIDEGQVVEIKLPKNVILRLTGLKREAAR